MGQSIKPLSPLFRGASTGLLTCSSPLRVHNPSYTRLTRGTARANDFVQHSYLIVRRGQRPSIKSTAQKLSKDSQEAQSLYTTMQSQAAKTKEGILDALRKNNSTAQNIPLAEIVPDETDKDAQTELLRMLPEILRQQQIEGKSEDAQEVDEAMRLAQSIMERSADLAESTTEEPAQGEKDAFESIDLTASLLDQQRAFEAEEKLKEESSIVEDLSEEDINSMRTEAFQWPRLVRTPMKKGGHVIFDACTAQASIDRFTLTRSMGRQTYQDARKAEHGDLLPYVPLTEEQPSFVEQKESSEWADHPEGVDVVTHVQNVKALLTSVPAADVTRRNAMPPNAKISRSSGKRPSAAPKRHFPWPASSAQAIGADLIAGGEKASPMNFELTGTPLGRRSIAETFTRRSHYKDGKGRGAEQVRTANAYSARENRKRSIESYREEVLEGWALPGENVNEEQAS